MASTGRILDAGAVSMTGLHTTTEVTALGGVPVTRYSGEGYATMLRAVVPVVAGELLDVDGRARVTNDLGYVIGVGYHLWAYDVDDGADAATRPWWLIGRLNGDNVEPKRHHMPLHLQDVYEVPADWPVGHRMVVVFRVDAHSTAWQSGDLLGVDDYGVLTVRRLAAVTP